MRRWHGDGRVCQLQPCRLYPRPGHDATRGGACPALAHLPACDVLSERRTDIIDTREVSKAGTGVLACYAGRVRHVVRTADMQGERTVDPRRRRGRGRRAAAPPIAPRSRRSPRELRASIHINWPCSECLELDEITNKLVETDSQCSHGSIGNRQPLKGSADPCVLS